MNKLKLLGIILASLSPLVATDGDAQLDLFSPVEVGLEGYCVDHPELRNDSSCEKYYRRNPAELTRPNTTTPKRSSVNSSPIAPQFIQALQNCNNSYIRGYVAGRRASNLPIPPQMLQRAQQCGAI